MYQLGLIGYPIQHSLSPWIHGQLLERAGIKGSYGLFEISPDDDFAERIKKLKEEVQGFNVTVPYKQKIIPYLDELNDAANVMQAVNTVVQRDGKWIGYNTDGIGYVRSLEQAYPHIISGQHHKALIIGAGGAARAIYHGLLERGITRVDIANRTIEKAKNFAQAEKTAVYRLDEIGELLENYDLIIQTTSVGMKAIEDQPIAPVSNLKAGTVVSDIVYQPIETAFLREAKREGAHLLFGHTMLLYQAQYAFEIWTGKRIDVTDMEQELRAILEGR